MNVGCGLAEAVGGGVEVRPAIEDAIASAHNRLWNYSPTDADSWLPIAPVHIERSAGGAVHSCESPAAQQRILQSGSTRVTYLLCVRVCAGEAEVCIDTVLPLTRRLVDVPAQPEIEGQVGTQTVRVLGKEPKVVICDEDVGVPGHAS